MIPFNKPCVIGEEAGAVKHALLENKLSGNGVYSKKCTEWLETHLHTSKALLTPSCTAALEMTALLMNLSKDDEVIMPSYTFVSTANAYVLRGAVIRFVDINPKTMNIDPEAIAAAVTPRTKAIVVVHYAGVACKMDAIMKIADEHDLWIVEDAAQALQSQYKGKDLGTIGHFGTFSFHDTKNYTCGEGGALLINHESSIERAEIIQEKGTNRSQFIKGMVDKYTWRDIGSSYLLSELNAAYLSVQLNHAGKIYNNRMKAWVRYHEGLKPLMEEEKLELPFIPKDCQHNAHMYYIKTADESTRQQLIDFLKEKEIIAVSHYVPLHSSLAGKKFGRFIGKDRYTTSGSERLVRLPLYYDIKQEDVDYVVSCIKEFYNK